MIFAVPKLPRNDVILVIAVMFMFREGHEGQLIREVVADSVTMMSISLDQMSLSSPALDKGVEMLGYVPLVAVDCPSHIFQFIYSFINLPLSKYELKI